MFARIMRGRLPKIGRTSYPPHHSNQQPTAGIGGASIASWWENAANTKKCASRKSRFRASSDFAAPMFRDPSSGDKTGNYYRRTRGLSAGAPATAAACCTLAVIPTQCSSSTTTRANNSRLIVSSAAFLSRTAAENNARLKVGGGLALPQIQIKLSRETHLGNLTGGVKIRSHEQ